MLDLDDPPQPNEIGEVLTLRAWFKYFNDRYQTYGRRVHGYIYYGGSNHDQSGRQAAAAAAYSKVKPFAAISIAGFVGERPTFGIYMAQQGVLNFGSQQGRTAAFFDQFPKLIWGYPPSVEQAAKVFIDYICTKVAGKKAVDAGGALANRDRKYGLISTADPAYPGPACPQGGHRQGRRRVRHHVRGEGRVPEERLPDRHRHAPGLRPDLDGRVPEPGGHHDHLGRRHRGELLDAGRRAPVLARVVPRRRRPERRRVLRREPGPAGRGPTPGTSRRRRAHRAPRHGGLLPGVPVGRHRRRRLRHPVLRLPDLQRPAPVLHGRAGGRAEARARRRSTRATTPSRPSSRRTRGCAACFYDPNDYTCVKDAQAMYWDPQGQVNAEKQRGCWRMVDGGVRHIFGHWPKNNIDADKKPGLIVQSVHDRAKLQLLETCELRVAGRKTRRSWRMECRWRLLQWITRTRPARAPRGSTRRCSSWSSPWSSPWPCCRRR